MNNLKISFLGPLGTFSSQAAAKLYPDAEYLPYDSLSNVIKALTESESNLAILPIENSTSSDIHEAVDLVINNQLKIISEIFIPISFNLISLQSSDPRKINQVAVHPQAAKQCTKFLTSNNFSIISASSNIQAQQILLDSNELTLAAISTSGLISDKLSILNKNINDHQKNFTRFIAVSLNTDSIVKDFSKVTALVKINHQPGSLAQVLLTLAKLEVNLTKIESRPIPGTDWEYLFWIDFLADQQKLTRFCELAKEFTNSLEIIGKYTS